MAKNTENLSPLKRAYLALEKAQTRLQSLERARSEGIAILGMGCRYPGGANRPAEYWDLLAAGRDAIVEVPASRWDVDAIFDADPDAPGKVASRYGGFIDDVDRFDAGFFGISPREAESLDPQQRLLLEVSQEAIEHAGLPTDRLRNSQTGVFMGVATCDYYCLVTRYARSKIDAYLGTGTSPNAAAGRLSYVFGLRGPCVAIDTACSSSLVAIHQACQSLRNGECDMALAGGVNVILAPELSITFSKARMLCEDGRCKTFDAAANGYVRGEGVGVIVLKRLRDAQSDGDRILAVIRGSASNQDGPSGGLTIPNGPSQQDVIRRALAVGDIQPELIDYLEAHGTGTALGDPIEMGAIGAVFGRRSECLRMGPLRVGAVKTNIGHLEGAAGIAGVMKTVLALEHEQIPPHLHFETPSPRIPWDELPVLIPTEPMPWPRGERRRLAGISSFGFSGINAHVVLEEAPAVEPQSEPQRPCHVLPLSAKHPQALRQLASRCASDLDAAGQSHFRDACFTAGAGRSHYEHRMAVVATTASEACRRLDAFARGEHVQGLHRSTEQTERPKVVFLFSGDGSQCAGMGRQLFETDPTFRKTFERCEEILREYLERPLREVAYGEDVDRRSLDKDAYAQPVLFALEYSLARLWQSWGVRPSVLIGHDVGEYVAACLAGVFRLQDGLKLAAARARLTSGAELEEFRRVAETITYTRPRTRLISSLSGAPTDEEIAGVDYWCNHACGTAKFAEGVAHLFGEGSRTFLEIGPQSTLLKLARECWEAATVDGEPRWLCSLAPDRPDWDTMLNSLAELYVAGEDIDWEQFSQGFAGRKTSLPTYPFQRRRYWIEPSDTDLASAAAMSMPLRGSVHPLLGRRTFSAAAGDVIQFEGPYSARQPAYLAEHQIAGTPILPAAAYMEVGLAAARAVGPQQRVVLEDVALEQALQLPRGQTRVVQVAVRPDSAASRFELYSRPSTDNAAATLPQWTLHATGRFVAHAEDDATTDIDLDALKHRCDQQVPLEGFYQRMRQYGLEYGPSFRGLRRLWRGTGEVLGEIELPEHAVNEAKDYLLYPPLLDACLHVTIDLVDRSVEGKSNARATFVPVGVDRLRLLAPVGPALFSHARMCEGPNPAATGRYRIDLDLIDPEGTLVARLEGLRAQQVDLSILPSETPDNMSRLESDAPPPRKIADELWPLPTAEQRRRITEFLEEEVVNTLKLTGQERPSHHKSLFDLGMDSLMSVEFLYRVNRGLGVNLPMQRLLENAAIAPLAEQLVGEMSVEQGVARTDEPAGPPATIPPPVQAMLAPENVWFPGHRIEPNARIRLFCFHSPEGSASDYAGWPGALRPDVEVCAVELPGSGTREDEHRPETWESLVESLAEQMLDCLDRPFAFFGFGGGSLLAFDVAHFIQDRFGLTPEHLFVASASAPGDEASADQQDADAYQFDTYRFTPRRPLDCSITAFAAKDDARIGRERLHGWYACTRGSFRLELAAGTSASQLEKPERLLRTVASDLRQAIEA